MLRVYNYIRPRGVTMIGPNCPGALSPGKANVGIIPAEIFSEGSIGLVSRSGTLTYQIGHELTGLGLGNSTIVGIGGDPVVGSSFIDILRKFEADPETRDRRDGRRDRRRRGGEGGARSSPSEMTKPVVAYIAGFSAPARQDDGPRGRDHHRLVRHRPGEEGGARGGRRPRRHVADRGRADRRRGRAVALGRPRQRVTRRRSGPRSCRRPRGSGCRASGEWWSTETRLPPPFQVL